MEKFNFIATDQIIMPWLSPHTLIVDEKIVDLKLHDKRGAVINGIESKNHTITAYNLLPDSGYEADAVLVCIRPKTSETIIMGRYEWEYYDFHRADWDKIYAVGCERMGITINPKKELV